MTGRDGQRGQVVALVALSILAIVMLLALLFDGAMALVDRRRMQDAADAAAMAGANVIGSSGCGTAGVPNSTVRAAVLGSLARNGYPGADQPTDAAGNPHTTATITCLADARWFNAAVAVDLRSPGARLVLLGLPVSFTASAMNGGLFDVAVSILTLSPDDCDSFSYSGTSTMTFEGSVHVDSSARTTACKGGSAAASGNGSGSIVMANGQPLEVVGDQLGVKSNVAPLTGVDPISDPFLTLDEPHAARTTAGAPLLLASTTKTTLPAWGTKSDIMVLRPGWYVPSSSRSQDATLSVPNGKILVLVKGPDANGTPGVAGTFVFDGIEIRNNGTICSLPSTNAGAQWTAATAKAICEATVNPKDTWLAACPTGSTGPNSCGVLLEFINPPTACFSPSAIFSTVAGGHAYLNPYFAPDASWDSHTRYNGFLIWTGRDIASSSGCEIVLQGGGTNDMVGTVYAPTVTTSLAGNPTGTGGTMETTMQVIGWNVRLKGDATLTFRYHAGSLAQFTGYGLVK